MTEPARKLELATNTPHRGPVDEARAAEPRKRSREGTSGWELAFDILQARLDRFVGCETKVLKGDDPEAIHDFRVASRRLQQSFDLLFPPPLSKQGRKLRRAIRRARAALSVARNCDVLLQSAESALASKRASHRESWKLFRDYLAAERDKSFSKATDRLTRMNLSGFYLKMQELLKEHPARNGASATEADARRKQEDTPHSRFEDRLAGAILRSWESFEESVENASRERKSRNLHAVRIAAKKVRYLVEVADEMNIRESKTVLKRLKRLQQLLGDWHDLEVMEESMARMIARPKFLRANLQLAIDTEKLMLANRSRKQRLEAGYFGMVAESGEISQLRNEISEMVSQPPLAGV